MCVCVCVCVCMLKFKTNLYLILRVRKLCRDEIVKALVFISFIHIKLVY